jgi:hypothetical protein
MKSAGVAVTFGAQAGSAYGGTSYAAIALPRTSVGARELKRGSVTATDVRKGRSTRASCGSAPYPRLRRAGAARGRRQTECCFAREAIDGPWENIPRTTGDTAIRDMSRTFMTPRVSVGT